MGNEKLAPIGVGTGVGHGEDAGTVVPEVFVELVFELGPVWPTAPTGSLGATGLDHETGDDTMESEAVVKTIIGEFFEIGDRLGNLVIVQLESDVSSIGLNQGNFHRDFGFLESAK